MASRKRKFTFENTKSSKSKRQKTINNKQTLSHFGFIKDASSNRNKNNKNTNSNRLLSSPFKDNTLKKVNNRNSDFILRFIDEEIAKEGEHAIDSEDKFDVDFNEMKRYFNRKNKQKDESKHNIVNDINDMDNLQNNTNKLKISDNQNDDEMMEFQLDVSDPNLFVEQFVFS